MARKELGTDSPFYNLNDQELVFEIDEENLNYKKDLEVISTMFDFIAKLFGNKQNSVKLRDRYLGKTGESMDIVDINGYYELKALVKEEGQLGKGRNTSLQKDFIKQVQSGKLVEFRNSYPTHNRVENFTNPFWSIGSATIAGRLTNVKASLVDDHYAVKANILYAFYDVYTEPLNVIPGIEITTNFGKPFEIRGTWKDEVRFKVDKEIYETKILPMLNQ